MLTNHYLQGFIACTEISGPKLVVFSVVAECQCTTNSWNYRKRVVRTVVFFYHARWKLIAFSHKSLYSFTSLRCRKLHYKNSSKNCNKLLLFLIAGSWSEDEIERLSAAVRASTGTDFGDQICRGICWTEVSTLVMTRTADQCRGKW